MSRTHATTEKVKPQYSGKLADPEFRKERARKAAAVANSLDSWINRVIRNAGDVTPEQWDRIRAILPPVGGA